MGATSRSDAMRSLQTTSQSDLAGATPRSRKKKNSSCCHQMTMEGPIKAEPAVNASDWRTCLLPDSRKKNANKIKGTLKKHIPNCGKEGNKELKKIAATFEELIFNTAIDQVSSFLSNIVFEII
ncbi:hypothetical protein DY000_02045469 [Brassica cretica]|uniref:Mediator complex subunit 15 KIX domain-containing protein n=1 Tax=Brassica cretica TaxID=69181 RepID=A0ABQ7EYD6_BRACR|nr:hypothetical protein DY000_02045469 [Brassica cretica]